MGVVSEIIPCFSHKTLFGYDFVVWCSIAIAVIGFFVWGHHMFVAGQSLYASVVFSLMSFAVAVPSAIKVFNWIGTMHKGFISSTRRCCTRSASSGCSRSAGSLGCGSPAWRPTCICTQTYFVVAHFHYVMVGGMVSAFFGGLHFWWPKITGRMYPEMWGRARGADHFHWIQHDLRAAILLGYTGMPRRYATYPPEYQVLNVMSSAGASVLALGYLLPLFYLPWSLFRGPRSPANPWDATGLEWQTSSPPPTVNFYATPIVTWEPYDYKEPERLEQIGLSW